MNFQPLIELSRELRELKKTLSADLAQKKIYSNENAIFFPAFPFEQQHLYPRIAPWMFNGFLLTLGENTLIIDPGVDFLTRAVLTQINVLEANILYISHAHVDHYAGAESVIEAMSFKQDSKKIHLIAAKTIFDEKRIGDFHSNIDGKGMRNVQPQVLSENTSIELDDLVISPVKMFHTAEETYGCVFSYKNLRVGYISDTGYTKLFETSSGETVSSGKDQYSGDFSQIKERHDWIREAFKNVDVLLCNLNDFIFTKHSRFHMTGYDLIDILTGSRVQKCVIMHFSQLDATDNLFLRELEKTIAQATGVETHACYPEGFKLDLSAYL